MSENNTLFESSEGKILTFLLGKQEYGIEILQAREVVGIMNIDPIPQAPHYVEGFINLRGKIIPVIDLRKRFGLAQVDQSQETCILVADIKGKQTGVIIDQLSGVVSIDEKSFEEAPDFGGSMNSQYILGMAKLQDRVIVVLDMSQIVCLDDLNF